MGWWTTGNGDEVIGDGPADKMMDTFINIVSNYKNRGAPILTIKEMLDVIVASLRLNPKAIVAEGNCFVLKCVVADIEGESGQIRSSVISEPDDSVVQSFFSAFKKIAVEYEDMGLNRKPRINELLATIDFVLGCRLESYSSITEEIPITRIIAEFDG